MGNLPNSRTVILTLSDPVPSALLNELQDVTIAFAHNRVPITIHPHAWRNVGTGVVSYDTGPSRVSQVSGAPQLVIAPQLNVGDRILTVSWGVTGDGVGDITASRIRLSHSANVVDTVLASSSLTNPTTFVIHTLTVGSPVALAAGESILIEAILGGSGSVVLWGPVITWDHPVYP